MNNPKQPKSNDKIIKKLNNTIKDLKSQLRQERKKNRLQAEELERMYDIIEDANTVTLLKKNARGERKNLTECTDCGIKAVEEFVTDLGPKKLIFTQCNNCGTKFGKRVEDA